MPRKKKTKAAKSSTTVATVTVKAEKSAVIRKERPSEAKVKAILAQVAQMKQKGTSIAQTLKDLNVPYANYHYWVKKYGAGEAASKVGGVKSESATLPKQPGRQRGSDASKVEKMQSVISDIATMRANGTNLNKAVKKHSLSVNNYYYWVKRLQANGPGTAQVGRKAARSAPSVKMGNISDLLDAMKRNRAEREKLDTEWQELKRRFEREG